MRIRKRSLPLLLSSSLPLTDPPLTKTHEHEPTNTKLHQPDPVTVVDDLGLKKKETHVHDQPSRSDLQLTIVRGKNGWFCLESNNGVLGSEEMEMEMEMEGSCSCWCMNKNQTHEHKMEIDEKMKNKEEVLEGLDEDEEEEKHKKIRRGCVHDNRKRNELDGAETISGVGVPPSSDYQVERWCDGDMAFPLKKRGGSFDGRVGEKAITMVDMKEKRINRSTKLKTKTFKKWVHHENDVKEDEEDLGVDDGFVLNGGCSNSTNGVRKCTESIEGSRCSRVNGRGWRCYQQALMGHSLCEHHLSKGRQRMRSRRISTSTARNGSFGTMNTTTYKPDDVKPLRMQINRQRNRKNSGVVKARSLSSLLGLTCAPRT